MNVAPTLRYLMPSVSVVVLGLSVLWIATDGLAALTEESARRLNVARGQPQVPYTQLETMYGEEASIGGPGEKTKPVTLVEFIYTSCPTVCQVAGDEFANLMAQLKAAGHGRSVQMVSISFDPWRDGPEELRSYAELHGADGELWTVSRVIPEDLPHIQKTFGLRVIRDNWGGFQHNAAIHVMNASGRLIGIVDIDDVEGALRLVETNL